MDLSYPASPRGNCALTNVWGRRRKPTRWVHRGLRDKEIKVNELPVKCTFVLNRQPTSMLSCNGTSPVAAFSGTDQGRDNPDDTVMENVGPLPQGTYQDDMEVLALLLYWTVATLLVGALFLLCCFALDRYQTRKSRNR